jgi:ribosomal protein S18 acetylase RimI-like enzyme
MIRKATIKDITLPGEIDRVNGDAVNKKIGLTKTEVTKHFRTLLKNKKYELYVFKDKGFIALKKSFSGFNNCEIEWLNVDKKFWRQGIAKKLVKFVEQRAKKLKFRGIYAYSHEIRKGAHKFYKKIGYKKINEFPKYYSNGDTSYLFGKMLK